GEIVCLSKNGKILWEDKISQTGIYGIYEFDDNIIIIDREGKFFRIDSGTGRILLKQDLKFSISSNLIFIRDWFVVSGNAAVWVFWRKDLSSIYSHTQIDPLIRKLYPNPSGFYTGDDDGNIQFWKFGFKIRSSIDTKSWKYMFERGSNSVILLNFKGIIINCNKATEELFNYKRNKLIGKKFLEFINFPPNHRSQLEDVYNRLTKGEILPSVEIQCFTKRERSIWVKIFNTLVRFDDSKRLDDEILILVVITQI
ncbi:MAG: PAS domain-containing protein, partial [Promethearchaeota archaeon]